ncbi:MAG: hypothetical protein HPY76_10865 [Anaerolineae bacterium]|nr:hypothetical protein [Anaerolineae bacterium]
MVKKILLGVLFAGVVGALVFGAVNRTIAKADDDVAQGERGRELALEQASSEGRSAANPQGQGRNQRNPDGAAGEALVPGADNEAQDGNGRQGGAGGRGASDNVAIPDPLAEVDEVVSLTGAVTAVTADELTLKLQDGTDFLVEGRAWSYAQEQGFATAVGNTLLLAGFYDDDGTYEVITIQDQTSGVSVTLREASGRPGWAGNGRGGRD